jgi:hypothetical protein
MKLNGRTTVSRPMLTSASIQVLSGHDGHPSARRLDPRFD